MTNVNVRNHRDFRPVNHTRTHRTCRQCHKRPSQGIQSILAIVSFASFQGEGVWCLRIDYPLSKIQVLRVSVIRLSNNNNINNIHDRNNRRTLLNHSSRVALIVTRHMNSNEPTRVHSVKRVRLFTQAGLLDKYRQNLQQCLLRLHRHHSLLKCMSPMRISNDKP